ncbi:MAG: cysteine desulfurase family protein [Eubacteriales bacterium]
MIYFDNSATTKPNSAAIAAVALAMETHWGNPSAVHRHGMEAEKLLQTAHKQVATALGATPDRVFFTSGGTEADNWAIQAAIQSRGKRGKHILTTAFEHHAILHPLAQLSAQGYEITYLKPDENGTISPENFRTALRPNTVFVSIMMVNNEIGSVQDIAAMVKATRRLSPDALFHTDAVQGFLKVPFNAKTLGVDMLSVSGHKVHGPKGAGALYIRTGLNLKPYLLGGGQERGLRSGTEPMPAILGFAAAVDAQLPTYKADISHMNTLKTQLLDGISQMFHVKHLGTSEAPHIVNLSIPAVRTQEIINRLQDLNIYVSAGSACARGHRSHVLESMEIAPALIDGAVRISFCAENTPEEVATLLSALQSFG